MFDITRHPSGKGFELDARMHLPVAREKLFAFFSDACQLETITPPWLHFHVITPRPIAMRKGTLIDYRLRLHGIPLRWTSHIRVWEPPRQFVDEQLTGPYRRWHHTHQFSEDNSGTVCADQVHYQVWGGTFVNWLLVARDLRAIFEFRQRRLREIFG